MCPNGVEFVKIEDVTIYEQPTNYTVKSTNYSDKYEIPVLTAGQTFILGYTNEKDGVYDASEKNPVIIFDDFTVANKWVDFKFKVKSSAMKIIKSKDESKLLIRFLYHLMQSIKYITENHERHWISKYSQIEIPVPPIEIQREIVRILDNFIFLTAELTARNKQYEYYRDKLLNDLVGAIGDSRSGETSRAHLMKLGDIRKVSMCKRIMKSETSTTGEVPFYKIGTFGGKADAYITKDLYERYKREYSFHKKGDVLISASGTIGKTIICDGEPAYFQDSNIVWIDNDETKVLNKYLFYFYQTNPWKISTGGTIARLYNDNLASI